MWKVQVVTFHEANGMTELHEHTIPYLEETLYEYYKYSTNISWKVASRYFLKPMKCDEKQNSLT